MRGIEAVFLGVRVADSARCSFDRYEAANRRLAATAAFGSLIPLLADWFSLLCDAEDPDVGNISVRWSPGDGSVHRGR